MKRGKFIVLEGGEGSGKGTIMAHLHEVLAGESVIFTHEPGGTPLSERIRELILGGAMCTKTELLLFEAARAEHVEQVILPALKAGTHVISDRFDGSTAAYQIGARWGGKYEKEFLFINNWVVDGAVPDLYLFCDVAPDVALARRMSAGDVNRLDKEAHTFHDAVYRGYQEFLKNKRYVSVDCVAPSEAMCRAAEAAVRTELGL